MGMTIDELITYCEEKEYAHRVSCKRYDDASGYTRSKDKNIRNASAVIEEHDADFYKEIADTMRKYQKVEEAYKKYQNNVVTNIYAGKKLIKALEEVLEDEQTN